MVVLGGWVFVMSEVPLYELSSMRFLREALFKMMWVVTDEWRWWTNPLQICAAVSRRARI